VWLVGGIFLVGGAVGLFVAQRRSPSYALNSELVYRLEIAATVVAALLFAVTTVRLASYGRTFTAFSAGPVKTEADDPASAMDAAVLDVVRLGDDVATTAAALEALIDRVASLEERLEG
jgi:cell shape-determining protein MreC